MLKNILTHNSTENNIFNFFNFKKNTIMEMFYKYIWHDEFFLSSWTVVSIHSYLAISYTVKRIARMGQFQQCYHNLPVYLTLHIYEKS